MRSLAEIDDQMTTLRVQRAELHDQLRVLQRERDAVVAAERLARLGTAERAALTRAIEAAGIPSDEHVSGLR